MKECWLGLLQFAQGLPALLVTRVLAAIPFSPISKNQLAAMLVVLGGRALIFLTEGSTFVKIECGLFSFVSSQLVLPMYFLVGRCDKCQGWIFVKYSGFVRNKAMICNIFFLLWAGGDFMTSISHKQFSYTILCSHFQELV